MFANAVCSLIYAKESCRSNAFRLYTSNAGTKNIINLCIKHNVPRLIYTSSASVTLTSYLGLAPFAVVVNQTESKTKTITKDQELLIPGYSVSKYRAEKIVLYANGTNLANDTGIIIWSKQICIQKYRGENKSKVSNEKPVSFGVRMFFYTLSSIICLFINEIVGELITTAIRPTVFYGEEDPYFFPTLAKVTKKTGGIIPKLLGAGGKHQMTYVGKSTVQCFDYFFCCCFFRFLSHSLSFHSTISFIVHFFLCVDKFAGNVAWAHIRAKETLKKSPKNIAGLPVFVTDDTPIEDTSRFCQRLSRRTNAFNIRPTSWSLPSLLGYWLCILLEMIIYLLNPIFGTKLSFQPRALSAYAGSLLQYSRLRAELHMDYEPLYNEERSLDDSAKWYESWYKSHFNKDKTSKKAT